MMTSIQRLAAAAVMALAAFPGMAQTATAPETTTPGQSAAEPATPAPAATPADTEQEPPLEGANSFTRDQAQSRMEDAGFLGITGLAKDERGIWRGTATKNGKSVKVALDYRGNVTEGQ